MTENQSPTTAADVLAALGMTGATIVTLDEYQALPANQRHSLSGPRSERHVFLRLPDPPPVAALREIRSMADAHVGDAEDVEGDCPVSRSIAHIASVALAEFDRPTP